ncbi:MAG TPA: hypothetical protein VMF67_14545 [Rhizomicrobium sp.]|nr:hypothetical protein [Rhizomicrobium sp.]
MQLLPSVLMATFLAGAAVFFFYLGVHTQYLSGGRSARFGAVLALIMFAAFSILYARTG